MKDSFVFPYCSIIQSSIPMRKKLSCLLFWTYQSLRDSVFICSTGKTTYCILGVLWFVRCKKKLLFDGERKKTSSFPPLPRCRSRPYRIGSAVKQTRHLCCIGWLVPQSLSLSAFFHIGHVSGSHQSRCRSR